MNSGSPNQPARACVRESCAGCEIQGRLICRARPADLVDFAAPALGWFIPFFWGMIAGRHWWGLGVWLGLAALFFGYVEAHVLCRHCPAYAEPGATLRCHANWGLPKLPPYDPRPLRRWEGWVFLGYAALLFLYHIPFMVASGQWPLLVWATWALIAAVWTVWRTQCNRCFHLSCPANHVPDETRRAFRRCYPDFRWDEGSE